jgi:hypothetical protein
MATKLKVLFFGYHGHLPQAERLRPLIEELGMELICINEKSTPSYNRLTILDEIRKANIVICPCDVKLHPAKSNNKVTQALSCGVPVIASPLQAYLEIEDPNLYIAHDDDEWRLYLRKVKDLYANVVRLPS